MGGDLKGGPITKIPPPSDPRRIRDSLWMPDGRMIYSLHERDEAGSKLLTCNLWQVQVDPRTSAFIGKPQRLTNFAELCATPTSVTSDSKQFGVFNGDLIAACM